MRKVFLSVLYLLLLTPFIFAQTVKKDHLIWKGQPYAAFTSLEFYSGYFYCAFREANHHSDNTGKDCGVTRIIRSKKGKTWELYQTFANQEHDLRDPQLCVTPDNRLMLTAEDVVYKENKAVSRCTVFSFKIGKYNFSDLADMVFIPILYKNWLWQPNNVNGKICGFLYVPHFAFAISDNGSQFQSFLKISDLQNPSEASVTFYKERYYALVRTCQNAELGISIDGESWQWFAMDEKIACPKLFVYNGRLLCVGRSYNGEKQQTTLFEIDTNGRRVKTLLHLSTALDCAYPGVVVHNGKIYVSYYQGNGKQSDIHFCEIKL